MARRSGLGKGLGALIPTEAHDRDSALREVPIDEHQAQPPATPHALRRGGDVLPGVVDPRGGGAPADPGRETGEGEFELIAGERRWRAARRAGLQTIPVLVQSVSDVHSLEQALVENLHREDLNPLEEAGAFQQLVDEFGYTHEQVAARVGKSRTAVTNTLRLLQLPAGVQRALADGDISAGHARALLGTPDRGFQEELAKRIVTEGLTVRAVEEGVRHHASGAQTEPAAGRERQSRRPRARSVRRLADRAGCRRRAPIASPPPGCSSSKSSSPPTSTRGSRSRWVPSGVGWSIDFATLEDLERIYRLMVGRGHRLSPARCVAESHNA